VTLKKKKKPQTKRMNRSARPHSDFPCLDQDETFAYIAGYTEGGFAYGVTLGRVEATRTREFNLFRVGN
jgi:hypothetical protein